MQMLLTVMVVVSKRNCTGILTKSLRACLA